MEYRNSRWVFFVTGISLHKMSHLLGKAVGEGFQYATGIALELQKEWPIKAKTSDPSYQVSVKKESEAWRTGYVGMGSQCETGRPSMWPCAETSDEIQNLHSTSLGSTRPPGGGGEVALGEGMSYIPYLREEQRSHPSVCLWFSRLRGGRASLA